MFRTQLELTEVSSSVPLGILWYFH